REIQRIPTVTPGEDIYATNRLVDLLTGRLGEPARALTELRRLIDKYPDLPAAIHARGALAALKERLHGKGSQEPSRASVFDQPSVDLPLSVSLALCMAAFVRQSSFLCRLGRPGRPALLGNVKRLSNERGEAFVRGLTILLLASTVARNHANHAVGIES